VFFYRQKTDISCIFCLNKNSSWFCLERIRKQNNCFADINLETAKALFAKINISIVIYKQSNRHNLFDISKIPNLFLLYSLAIERNYYYTIYRVQQRVQTSFSFRNNSWYICTQFSELLAIVRFCLNLKTE